MSLEHLNICILRIFFFLFTFSQKYPHVFRILARTEDIAFDLDTRTPVTVWLVLHQTTVKTVCGRKGEREDLIILRCKILHTGMSIFLEGVILKWK